MKLPSLQSQFIAISGTIDLTTPPIVKANGDAIIAQNVQPKYGGGFSRIEGYECLDGKTLPSRMTYCHLTLDAEPVGDLVNHRIYIAKQELVVLGSVGNNLIVACDRFVDIPQHHRITLDQVMYQIDSVSFIDVPDLQQHKAYLETAFQLGAKSVAPVPNNGELSGVLELNECVMAFRHTHVLDEHNKCELFMAKTTGWVKAPQTCTVYCQERIEPQNSLSRGKRVRIGSNDYQILDVTSGLGDRDLMVIATDVLPTSGQEIFIESQKVATVAFSLANVISAKDNWQFVYHNFYGDLNGFSAYGCNGKHVIEIRETGEIVPIILPESEPQHICVHKNHLFVAFKGGKLGHSLVGNPTQWSVLLGSEYFALGDEITALSSQSGVLLIGCTRKVAGLYGSTRDDWVLRDITSVGIHEGTLQKAFLPIAMSTNGIIRIDQAEQFDDFRLNELDANQKLGKKVLNYPFSFSSTKPKENQIRFYSKTGSHLCIMLLPNGQSRCTYFNYPDKLYGVWQSPNATFMSFGDGKVYIQSERCLSFSGKPIEWVIKMAFNHCGSPTLIKSWHSAEFQATAEGSLSMQYRFDLDYNADEHAINHSQSVSVVGNGGRWNESLWNDFLWSVQDYSTPTLYLKGYSRNLSLTIAGNSASDPQFEITGLILNYIPRRRYRV